MAFDGFPRGALTFLGDLAKHNDRTWFAENRARYDNDLLGPERAFIDTLGDAFASYDPRVHADSAVNKSIFRINRDTRFSKDKSPYKTYADMWFWIGDDRKGSAGYFIRLVPDAVWVGGGAHWLSDPQLARYRAAVVDDSSGPVIERLLGDLGDQGYALGEQTLKRAPSGFSAQHPRADLLRYTAVHAIDETSPPPAEMQSAEFVGWCMERFARVRPLVDWLAETIGPAGPPKGRR